MPNTKSLSPEERKKAKRQARKKNKEILSSLPKSDRKRFMAQLKDKKNKNKEGLVRFVNNLKAKESAK